MNLMRLSQKLGLFLFLTGIADMFTKGQDKQHKQMFSKHVFFFY